MDLLSLPPVAAMLDLTASGLMTLITFLTPVAGPLSAALAVVLLTLVVRAALVPVGIAQAKAEQTRARLAPRLRTLQTRHRNDRERLQRETMKLYRDEGASPFAGCLPLLLQAPVVGLVYAVFLHTSIAGHDNPLLGQTLFGVPLGRGFVSAVAEQSLDPATVAVTGAIVVALAVIAELTRRLLRPPAPASDQTAVGVPPAFVGALPFVTAVIALFVPTAAALYLLTTSAWTLGQRLILRRVYPPEPVT
ncbi:membrane protein insertase YidC [Microbacterium sp. VKM Ac-2870]|uniref:YidC/Oxa1 family membrane protein insertase n=1 Tax=Microbacterium sp. VKM Ac-2870 TaxID=2783825 RepID=UPI00188CE3A6|nr:membrane protein insertase YidC [Microbacterium sp. VKM Ac-2870]MBF4563142.1 membrane protein insertase YidC [Microbacterium sp. VKM Ac-2870]